MSEYTLEPHEYHPAADSAKIYVSQILASRPMLIEAIASTALSGNRQAQVCHSTINRLLKGQPVSDRYLLGLAWTLRDLEKEK